MLESVLKDKNANTARMFVAKNRHGPDGLIFPMFVDTSVVQLKVLAAVDQMQSAVINTTSPQELASTLKEKYKNFRSICKMNFYNFSELKLLFMS